MKLTIAIILLLACAACGDLPGSPSPSLPDAVKPAPQAPLTRTSPIVLPQEFPLPPGAHLEPAQ